MKIRHYLNLIEDRKVLAILRVFVKQPDLYSGRQMSQLTDMSHRTSRKYLDSLVQKGILTKCAKGSAYLYSLSRNYFTEEIFIPLIKKELALYKNMKSRLVRMFSKYCVAIIIFGSYARNEEQDDSDMDICFIISDNNEAFLKKLESFTDEMMEKYELTISPYVLTRIELKEKKNLDVVQNIKKEGDWIYGEKSEIGELW